MRVRESVCVRVREGRVCRVSRDRRSLHDFFLFAHTISFCCSAEDGKGTIRIYQGRDSTLLHTLEIHSAPVTALRVRIEEERG